MRSALLSNPARIEKEDHQLALKAMVDAYLKTNDFGYLSQAREHLGWLYNFHLRSAK